MILEAIDEHRCPVLSLATSCRSYREEGRLVTARDESIGLRQLRPRWLAYYDASGVTTGACAGPAPPRCVDILGAWSARLALNRVRARELDAVLEFAESSAALKVCTSLPERFR